MNPNKFRNLTVITKPSGYASRYQRCPHPSSFHVCQNSPDSTQRIPNTLGKNALIILLANMRCLAPSLIAGLLLGCGSAGSPHAISWNFDVHHDERDQPRGKVWLVVDGQRHMITDDPMGGYEIIAPKDYPKKQVPSDAVVACTAWWAGSGEDMYVRIESNRALVFRRESGESPFGIPPYSLFRTIPIQR